MYHVPIHIKEHVDRIIDEYVLLHHSGFKIALQMYRENRIFSGIETTEYCLNEVRKFRRLLDNPTGSMFVGPESEVNKRIYKKICDFYAPLSPEAIKRITHTTKCQDQLEKNLRAARMIPALANDAKHLSWFIKNSSTISWNQTDENVCHKQFKLVRDESYFDKLLSDRSCLTVELTTSGDFSYTQIRIIFQLLDIETIYRKRAKMRQYKNFWDSAKATDDFDLDYIVFNMWNDVATTGIYYVYIPETQL